MNHISTEIQKHCIAIDHDTGHGSGVLAQGISREYSYVLTARHVLQKNKDDLSKGIHDKDSLVLSSEYYSSLNILEIYFYDDQNIDLAVIKVEFIDDLLIYPYEYNLDTLNDIFLYGCPETNEVELYSLTFIPLKKNKLEFSTKESTAQGSDIDGFSGGGFFLIQGGEFYLCGIETEIKQKGFVTRIKGHCISTINEFLNLKKLARLGAAHLADFKRIQPITFSSLNLYEPENLDQLIKTLHYQMQEKICNSAITPIFILEKFKEKILLCQQQHKELEDKELWVDFLEFIVIQVIISFPSDLSEGWENKYLNELSTRYKLIYINEKCKWRSIYKNERLPSHTSEIDNSIKIIILGHKDSLPDNPELNGFYNKTIIDISTGLQGERIDNPQRRTPLDNSIIHWHKLNEVCISDKEDSYSELNNNSDKNIILNSLKQDYQFYLENKEN
jgi:hypothetical protein